MVTCQHGYINRKADVSSVKSARKLKTKSWKYSSGSNQRRIPLLQSLSFANCSQWAIATDDSLERRANLYPASAVLGCANCSYFSEQFCTQRRPNWSPTCCWAHFCSQERVKWGTRSWDYKGLRQRRYWGNLMNSMTSFATLGFITKSARTLDVPSLLLVETFTATVTCTKICEMPQR